MRCAASTGTRRSIRRRGCDLADELAEALWLTRAEAVTRVGVIVAVGSAVLGLMGVLQEAVLVTVFC